MTPPSAPYPLRKLNVDTAVLNQGAGKSDTRHQRWTRDDGALVELLRQRQFRLGDDTVEDDPGWLDIVDQIRPLAGEDQGR